MTIKECYASLGLNFDAVKERMLSEERVERFAFRFIDNTDFAELESSISKKDWNRAFEAAHTIKGVALNLGFDRLSELDSELTEILRPRTVSDIDALSKKYDEVRAEYEKIICSLVACKKSR